MAETDCHALNDRFITWMENEYMKSGYLDSMPFSEFLWSFKDRMKKKWEAENGGGAQRPDAGECLAAGEGTGWDGIT